jgi:hypothetical protein
MNRKGVIIDPGTLTMNECEYVDKKIEGMYFSVTVGSYKSEIMPAAYVSPIENKEKVQECLDILKASKKAYDDKFAEIYYKVFPTLR